MKKLIAILLIILTYQSVQASANIPGPRDCFWLRGPVSGDPYINVAYPDSNVFYWAAAFTMPEGSRMYFEGEFPYARYMSVISYDNRGRPLESLADYLIQPSNGASNPFVDGSNRLDDNRGYKIEVLNKTPAVKRETGRVAKTSSNIIHAPEHGPQQQIIVYRIYLPNTGTAPLGGVGLPEVIVEKDGKTLKGKDACKALNSSQDLAITVDALGIPPIKYRELASQPDKPMTWPAQNPPEWYIQLDRQSLIGIYTGEFNNNAPRSTGGFFPNLDNHYLRTIVNRKYGKVLLIKAKAPRTPKTFNGNSTYEDNELRYWSICSNQSFGNTRVNDCLFDEEIPVDENGYFTIAISKVEDRPRNAIKECGLAWLPIADDGDGVFDDDVAIVQFRHMLAQDDFPHSIQSVENQAGTKKIMREYYPRGRYLMPNQVESFVPCPID